MLGVSDHHMFLCVNFSIVFDNRRSDFNLFRFVEKVFLRRSDYGIVLRVGKEKFRGSDR